MRASAVPRLVVPVLLSPTPNTLFSAAAGVQSARAASTASADRACICENADVAKSPKHFLLHVYLFTHARRIHHETLAAQCSCVSSEARSAWCRQKKYQYRSP